MIPTFGCHGCWHEELDSLLLVLLDETAVLG